MENLDRLRGWLADQKGDWSRIARSTDISTKTIHRIVNDESYCYRITFTTYLALDNERLQSELKKIPA